MGISISLFFRRHDDVFLSACGNGVWNDGAFQGLFRLMIVTVVVAYVSVYGVVSSPTVLSVVNHCLDEVGRNYPRSPFPLHVSVGPSSDFDVDAGCHHPGHDERRYHSLWPGRTVRLD